MVALVAMLAAGAAAAPLASATITPTRDATALARAMAQRPAQVTSASFVTIPPSGNPAAISTSIFSEFPRAGQSFAILSSGDASRADRPNNAADSSADNAGSVVKGAQDVTTLRVSLNVPAGASCLSLRFRYLSEEFPEFVDSPYNDAFIAELDASTWDAASITGPLIGGLENDFALDQIGRPITVNAAGVGAVSPGLASGTTYDAGTRVLRASTPVTPGAHSIFLTIFDQADRIYDSTVLIDQLTLNARQPCAKGIAADNTPGPPRGAILLPSGRVSALTANLFPPQRLVINGPRRLGPKGPRGEVRTRFQIGTQLGILANRARVTARSVPRGLLRYTTRLSDRSGNADLTLRPTAALRRRGAGPVDVHVCARKNRESETRGISTCRIVRIGFRPRVT